MGVYSMLLAGGQLIGSILGAYVADPWGIDGMIGATIVLGLVALVTLPPMVSTNGENLGNSQGTFTQVGTQGVVNPT